MKTIYADTIALRKLQQLNNKPGIIQCLLEISTCYYNLGEYGAALPYARRAVDLSAQINNQKLLILSLNKTGANYTSLSDYPEALNCFLQQLRLLEKTGDKSYIAKTQGNIGLLYYYLKKYPEALVYSKKCLIGLQQLNDKPWVAASLNNIGSIYLDMGDYANAITYNKQALQINQQVKSPKGIGNDLMDIGVAYYKQKDFTTAYKYMSRAGAIYDSLGAKNNMAITLGHLALMYAYAPDKALPAMGIQPSQRFEKAIHLQQKAIALCAITKSRSTKADQWKNLTIIYQQQNNYKEAYKSLNTYTALKDSIFNDKKRNDFTRLNIAYEFDKKEAALKAENAAKKAEVLRQKVIKNAAIVIGITVLLSGLALFIFYKRRKDAHDKLIEAEYKAQVADTEMKALRARLNPHFIFNSLNSIGQYIANNDKETADIYLVHFAKLMRMILENSQHQTISLADDLKVLELYMQLEALRLGNKLTYHIKVDENIDADNTLVPPMLLQPFVENSIWHGISPRNGEGEITVSVKKDGDMIFYMVEDNGIGRKRSAELKKNKVAPPRESLGIKVIQSRIDIMNNSKQAAARIDFTDMDQGTKVSIKLPHDLKF